MRFLMHVSHRILQARFDTEVAAAEAAVAMCESDCDVNALRLKRQQCRFKTWFASMWQVYRKAMSMLFLCCKASLSYRALH
jgi:hypothetical protein